MACIPVPFSSSTCRLQGGIKAVYVGVVSDVNYIVPVGEVELGEITDLGAVTLYKFENTNNVGTATETVTRANTVSFAQTVTATGRGFSVEAIKSLNFLSKAEMFAVVHYNSGVSRLYGAEYYLLSNGGENTSGEASGDSNSFTVTLGGIEFNSAPLLLDSSIDNPFIGLTTAPTIVE